MVLSSIPVDKVTFQISRFEVLVLSSIPVDQVTF
jgi:hypothetical protein